MKVELGGFADYSVIPENVVERSKHERFAIGSITTETLSKLNINIEVLPVKCQQLLKHAAALKAELNIEQIDPLALSLQRSRLISEDLDMEYKILKLQQKNIELQLKIDQNKKFIDGLKRDLKLSKESLAAQDPNPDNIQEVIRQIKQRLLSYQESCEKSKVKLGKLSIPESIYPSALMALISTLATLKTEAAQLQHRVDDVLLTRNAKEQLKRLRRQF